jgi:hypothetical protein
MVIEVCGFTTIYGERIAFAQVLDASVSEPAIAIKQALLQFQFFRFALPSC